MVLDERIRRELEGQKTGFDEIMEHKVNQLKRLASLVQKNPNISIPTIVNELGVSFRTAYRYLSIIRRIYKYKSRAELQLEDKKRRKRQLREVMEKHPSYTKVQLAKHLGVSIRTLNKYLKEGIK